MATTTVEKIQEASSEPVSIRRGGLRWLVTPPFQDLLFDEAGLRLPAWLEQGQAQIVKKGPHRIVYRVELPELTFYLKHNRIPDMRTWLRQFIRPGKARMEYCRALAVAARGVATIEPLAVGESGRWPGGGESFLITRSLPETVQLNHFLEKELDEFPARRQEQIRKRLAAALGQFIARLHNRGILHNDLHCGNILIRLDEDDQPVLYLIDLQALRLRSSLNWSQSKANLVMFNRWLSLRASRTDRLRFWRSYVNRRRDFWQSQGILSRSENSAAAARALFRDLARDLETATFQSNDRFWRRREQRCFQVTRHNRRLCTRTLRGYAVTDLDPQLLTELLQDPESPFSRPDAILLKNSRSAKVVEFTACIGGHEQKVIYKRFGVTKMLDPLLSLVRPSPTIRSWLFGHSLRERALPTARPLAFFHRTQFGLGREGYMLMEKIDAAGDLRKVLAAMQSLALATRRVLLRRRIDQLARLIRELHHRQLAHRDLKAANILLRTEPSASDTRQVEESYCSRENHSSPFCFIDLVGVSRPIRLRRRIRIKNLSRLHASFHQNPRLTRTDKLRFLRVYLQWGLFGKEGWKDWWRKLEEATQTKVQKNLRNGRPLA